MAGAVSGFVPYEMKTSLVKILSYDGKQLRGTLSNPYFTHEMCFDNVIQFLTLVDQLLEAINYPMRAMEARRFKPDDINSERGAALNATADQPIPGSTAAPLATFRLNVLFRQNASWQGRLVWVEEKSEAQFRSVLELLMLIDNVIS